jgi:hypothetical protein
MSLKLSYQVTHFDSTLENSVQMVPGSDRLNFMVCGKNTDRLQCMESYVLFLQDDATSKSLVVQLIDTEEFTASYLNAKSKISLWEIIRLPKHVLGSEA